MPDLMQTMVSQSLEKRKAKRLQSSLAAADTPALPRSLLAGMLRGSLGACPRCGTARLFSRFLKPVQQCPHCGQDWTHQKADDLPAFVAIFLTGFLVLPLVIGLVLHADLSLLAILGIVVSAMLVLLFGTLQTVKGAIIALQWWFGMHGFEKERHLAPLDEAAP